MINIPDFRSNDCLTSALTGPNRALLLIVVTKAWTMRKATKGPGEKIVKDIKRATRKYYSSEQKIRIALGGLRSEDSIAERCRREGISQGISYKWSKDFMEAGKK